MDCRWPGPWRGTWRTRVRAFTLFATHYFELTALAAELPGVVNLHLDATEHGDELVFLHAVREGPANRSYGLAVAKLAGVPRDVISRGAGVPGDARNAARGAIPDVEHPQGELLCGAGTAVLPRRCDWKLAAIEPDELTPREALQKTLRSAQGST